jgi:nitroreductase
LTDHDVLEVIRQRWSPRAFDASREIPSDDLRSLFEAARWAPSSFNEQPWRFVMADRRRTPEAFAALLGALDGFNQAWARHAPVLLLVTANRGLQRTGQLNRHAWYDTGQAVGLLTLQATSFGLGLRQMEGFDRALVIAACSVPAEFEPVVMIAVGYPGDPERLESERHRVSETQPRRRQPIETFVFEGTWGNAIERQPPRT